MSDVHIHSVDHHSVFIGIHRVHLLLILNFLLAWYLRIFLLDSKVACAVFSEVACVELTALLERLPVILILVRHLALLLRTDYL